MKVTGSQFVILVLYVDDILLAANDKGMLRDVKEFLSKNFEMKDMGEASYVIGIEIFRDRSQGVLGLSQKAYINKVLERYRMDKSDELKSHLFLVHFSVCFSLKYELLLCRNMKKLTKLSLTGKEKERRKMQQ